MQGIDDILAETDGGQVIEAGDLEHLTRTWVNERHAPEVLPWPSDLMNRVLSRINRQVETIEQETGTDHEANFRLIIIQTELERFKFLVRSYLHARIRKIDAFPLHHTSPAEAEANLSPSERQYLSAHNALLHQHYHSAFLSQLPPTLQRLDDKAAGGISMVEGPNLDKAVFARALRDMEEIVEVPGTNIKLALARGEVAIVRWSTVRDMVSKGVCQLV